MNLKSALPIAILSSALLTACSSTDTGADAVTTADEVPATAEKGLDTTTCEELLPDVIELTKDEPSGSQIVAVYQPKTVKDAIKAFNDGTLKMPTGKNQVEVLTCSGSAQFDDAGAEVGITFGMQVDTNDDVFIRYNTDE